MKVTVTVNDITMDLGVQQLAYLVGNIPDIDDNQDIFEELSNHTSFTVRREVAYKDCINTATALNLLNDTDPSVLYNILGNEKAKEVITEQLVDQIISYGYGEVTERLAESVTYMEEVDHNAVFKKLLELESPAIDLAIANNYSASKAILKKLLKSDDTDIVNAAKSSLE